MSLRTHLVVLDTDLSAEEVRARIAPWGSVSLHTGPLPQWNHVARFRVEGNVRPTERARHGRGRGNRPYTPQASLDAQRAVGWAFRRAAPGHRPDRRLYAVHVMAWYRDRYRRDVDNIAKTVMDGLNGIAWADDAQVASLAGVHKALDRDDPHALIDVWAIAPPGDRSG